MMRKKLLCYAEGHDGSWEAFCLDLDLAVQGHSFAEVYSALRDAIQDYVDAALTEDAENRMRLLNRRAPIVERVKFFWRYLTAIRKTDNSEMTHGFTILSPA